MSEKPKKIAAMLLTALLLAGILSSNALTVNPAGIVPMGDFLGGAQSLAPGSATANKVVNPVAGDPRAFDIELYVAGLNPADTHRGIDVVFAVDTSGSMAAADITAARHSVLAALDTLFGGDTPEEVRNRSRAAVITYNERANAGNFHQEYGGTARYWTTSDTWTTANRPGSGGTSRTDRARVDSTTSNRMVSGSFWATANATNTQSAVHAAHWLLQNPAHTPRTGAYADNAQVIILMTDGAPNVHWQGSNNSNTANIAVNGVNRRYLLPTLAPGSFTATGSNGWSSAGSATGTADGMNRALAQINAARAAGIATYTIGYRNATNSTQFDNVNSNISQFLRDSGTYYPATSAAALATIMTAVTTQAAAAMNNFVFTDTIGAGFSLVDSVSAPQQALLTGLTSDNYTDADQWTETESAARYDEGAGQVLWNLGTVENNTLYRVTFRVRVNDPEHDVTYFTDGGPDTVLSVGAEGRRYLNTTANKLTYAVNGEPREHIVYACESYSHTGVVPAAVNFTKLVAGEGTGTFTFTLSSDVEGENVIGSATVVIPGSGAGTISIDDLIALIGAAQYGTFYLREIPGGGDSGVWDYDNTVFPVVIDRNGNVSYPAADAPATEPVFTNEYVNEPDIPSETGFDVTKEAAEYTASAGVADGYDWAPAVVLDASGRIAIFKMTIVNKTAGTLELTGISDVFAGADLADATFYTANGEETTLTAIYDGRILNVGESVTFYYVTSAITERNTFVNTVTVTATDGGNVLEDSGTASVVASWTDPVIPGPGPTPGPTPDPEPTPDPGDVEIDIPNDDIPLDPYDPDPGPQQPTPPPEEGSEIADGDVPLSDLPKTGKKGIMPLMFGLFVAALAGLIAVIRMKKRAGERQ